MGSEVVFEILGLGIAAVDDILFVPSYPVPDTKNRVVRAERHGGGLTATALVAASTLGARCAYAGALGQDEESQYVRERLSAAGVDLSLVAERPDARPVHATVIVDMGNHTRTILVQTEGALGAAPDWPAEDVIRRAKVLFVDHVGTTGILRAARIAREAAIPVVGDIEGGAGAEYDELLQLVDHLIVSWPYAHRLTGCESPSEALRKLWHQGRSVVAITCGSEGAWYLDAAAPEEPRQQSPFTVDVVDTTGCGDVFHGAYAAGLAKGLHTAGRIRLASATAALKATRSGGQSVPTLDEVQVLLQEGSDEH